MCKLAKKAIITIRFSNKPIPDLNNHNLTTMLIPNSNDNIYPRNQENIRAILDFYFHLPDGNIDFLLTQKELKTNQIQFIAKQVSDNLEFFKAKVPNGLTISNLMSYGIDALAKSEPNRNGSKSRQQITKEFRDIVTRTQAAT